MKAKNFGYSIGALDAFDISENQMTCSGWIASLEPQPAERLQVTIGGVPVESAIEYPLPSPDVQAVWPKVAGAARCRFMVRAQLTAKQIQQLGDKELVSISSYDADGLTGIPLERAWPMSFKSASPGESGRVGAGDFVETSFSFLSLFRLLAGLRRDDHVLDAGCGLGRMAFGLAHYLDADGRYEGFDISPDLVEMARARFPSLRNFRFQHANIYNKMYNARGDVQADKFVFPYERETFSFVFLTSVFTHMLAADVQNYLREIRRVLRPGGRCLATFFVMDDEAKANVRERRSTIRFRYELADGCFVQSRKVPENAVAYGQDAILEMISNAGLKLAQCHKGQWPGRTRFLTYQDVYLLEMDNA